MAAAWPIARPLPNPGDTRPPAAYNPTKEITLMLGSRWFAFTWVVAVAACGGKSSPTIANAGGAVAIDRLPWEAALEVGATFALEAEGEDGPIDGIEVEVVAVEQQGAARLYRLSWGAEAGGGPTEVWVEDGKVRIGDATLAAMQPPWSGDSGSWCYAEDFSNPEGCDDVCDAQLCFSANGVIEVGGLYAPGYLSYRAR